MIDLIRHPDPVRVFTNALETGINHPGTFFAYHEGDCYDHIGLTPIGNTVRSILALLTDGGRDE